MFRKGLFGCLVTLLTFGLLPIASVSAAPPERIEVPDYIALYLDEDQGTSIWVNITAVSFCTWAAGGFNGPAPVVDDAVPAKLKGTGQDGSAFVGSINASIYVEVWELDNPDGPFLGPCEDIIDQLLSGGSPWATGTARVNAVTNNVFGTPEARAISGNFGATATLTTNNGEAFRYQINDHFGDRCFEFRCAATHTSLRAL